MENAAQADSAAPPSAMPDSAAARIAESRSAESQSAGPVWRFLIQPRWLGWHVLMVACFWGMLWLGDWQLHRALSGNGLSWAYTFEWPLFAGFAVVFWAKTIKDEFRIKRGEAMPGSGVADDDLPVSARAAMAAQASAAPDEPEDEELSAYNAYLARLNEEVSHHGKWHGWRS
jgi:DNA-binding transcriptional regulator of glucitol operon